MAPRYFKKGTTWKTRTGRRVTLAKKVASLTRQARVFKPEVKPFEAGALVAVSNVGSVTNLCIPTQGTTYINREGIRIQPRALHFRAQVEMAAAASSSFLRVIFFRGVRETGVSFTVADILQTATMDSPLVWLARDRFTVLSDRTHYFSDGSAYGKMIVLNKKLTKPLIFTGNGTGVQDGGIYMLLLSNEPVNTVAFDWYTRCTFTDV